MDAPVLEQYKPALTTQSTAPDDERLRAVHLLIEQVLDQVPESQDYMADVWSLLRATSRPAKKQPPFTLLPFLCCAAAGEPDLIATPIAAAWRLLILAALILDHVQDQDPRRSIAANLDPARATNVGVGLVFAAQLALSQLPNIASPALSLRVIADFQKASLRVCAGQHRDLCPTALALEDGWDVIALKSGEPFALACRSGACIGGGTTSQVNLLGEFGHHLGILNQIANDWAGIWDPSDQADLLAGRKNLPVLYSLGVASVQQREHLEALLKRASSSSEAREELRKRVGELGALHYLLLMAELHRQQARAALEGAAIPDSIQQQLEAILEQTGLSPRPDPASQSWNGEEL